MNAHWIGINHERTAALAEAHYAIALLKPAEQKADENACHGSYGGYHAALEEEDAHYLLVACTEITKGEHVVLLVDDEHRDAADDVEARHYSYKG